jgi:hypothetical protein
VLNAEYSSARQGQFGGLRAHLGGGRKLS